MHFGPFELDLRAGELHKNRLKIKLQIQPFKILEMLLQRPGELITREEIRAKLWPADTFIDFEHSVNSSIKKLREALCDDAETPRYIETLPRRGYRFIAHVETGGSQNGAPAVAPVEVVAPVSPPATAAGTLLQHVATVREPPRRRGSIVAFAAAVLATALALTVAFNVAGVRDRLMNVVAARHGVPLPQIESIAVLPLENLSRDPEQEYFVDGMTDALISDLGKIDALRVVSRTTMVHYKGTKKTLPEIARELNVDAVVEGAVLRSGGKVRVNAELIDARADRQLWANSYESELQDVLVLQGEVARAITEAVSAKATPQESPRLGSVHPVNPEAYEAYLRGRFQFDRNTLAGHNAAMEYFQIALKKDPDYAPAYVGIGHVWMSRGNYALPPSEALPKAKAAVLKALELDSTLADAHEALASIKYYYEWDWPAAEKEFKRAIELNPNSATLRVDYSDLLHVVGRPEEATAQIERALLLDPLNLNTHLMFGLHLMFLRQYDAAITQAHKLLKIQPDSYYAPVLLQAAFYKKGMLAEQLAEQKKTGNPEFAEALDRGYARGGYREAERAAAEMLVTYGKHDYMVPAPIAVCYAYAGEKERALYWLEKTYEARSPDMVHIGVAPDWDSLRSEPRFQALLRRMNFRP